MWPPPKIQAPNLTLLAADGTLLDQVEFPDMRQNSIRHLALSGDAIAFAMQWEGDPSEPVPQLGLWTPGTAPTLCTPPEAEAFTLQGYAGSIAATPDRILITSPKGGAVMLFDSRGTHVATHHRPDLCGAATTGAGFTVTDGGGAIWSATDDALTPLAADQTQWDNHLVSLS